MTFLAVGVELENASFAKSLIKRPFATAAPPACTDNPVAKLSAVTL